MSKVLILVEGQIEETFVKTALTPHLMGFSVFPTVTIITTRRIPDRKDFKGGITNYRKVKTDLRPLLNDSSAALVVSPNHIDAHFPSQNGLQQLAQIKAQFLSPEDINDNVDTAPSKRLRRIYPEYQKRTDGPTIAGKIGLELIRHECRRFNEWLTKLESLGGGPT